MIYTVISVEDVGSLSVSIAKMLGPTVLYLAVTFTPEIKQSGSWYLAVGCVN